MGLANCPSTSYLSIPSIGAQHALKRANTDTVMLKLLLAIFGSSLERYSLVNLHAMKLTFLGLNQ